VNELGQEFKKLWGVIPQLEPVASPGFSTKQ
jgi:hypothetical protein